ncbi:MAG: dihydropteroate synthase [Candidatus Delongbacteria bacterium]|nr:dihydropteroate synthase [Candidatus Delongbacteria bacterium]
MVFKARDKYFDLAKRPLIMGILNVTPDSFSDGGKFLSTDTALARCRQMIEEGADIIDIGGESSKPGSVPVSEEEELKRIVPVIRELRKSSDICISVDTYKPSVAQAALEEGADMINSICGTLNDDKLLSVVKKYSAAICIMHMKGTPEDMQNNTDYDDIVKEVSEKLRDSAQYALNFGISRESIAIDPGIGFGKSVGGNLEILGNLKKFKESGFVLLVGTSRKSFIAKTLGNDEESRLYGTLSSNVVAYCGGAEIFRVHDIKQNKKVLEMAALISYNECNKRSFGAI